MIISYQSIYRLSIYYYRLAIELCDYAIIARAAISLCYPIVQPKKRLDGRRSAGARRVDAAGAAARGGEDEAGGEAESDECVSFERITPGRSTRIHSVFDRPDARSSRHAQPRRYCRSASTACAIP